MQALYTHGSQLYHCLPEMLWKFIKIPDHEIDGPENRPTAAATDSLGDVGNESKLFSLLPTIYSLKKSLPKTIPALA